MGANSAIEWTHHTFNPWWGCAKVSPACKNCYADTFSHRLGLKLWGEDAPRRFFGDGRWAEPLKWNCAAEKRGVRERVFCASMADVFEARADLDRQRERLWSLIEECAALDWLLLTKRPENIWSMIPSRWMTSAPHNVWYGVTAENQQEADRRIPILAQIPATVRFVSYEPALDAVSFRPWLGKAVDWLIIGGESGAGARPFDIHWAIDAIADCRIGGAAPFVKQLGARPYSSPLWEGDTGFDIKLKDRKGGDMEEWDECLRVREFPRPRIEMPSKQTCAEVRR